MLFRSLDQAAERGDFPYRPSDLFLNVRPLPRCAAGMCRAKDADSDAFGPQMYADVLTCLSRRPLAGNVSPALLGTSGTIPLSIVSTIPDIMRHYYDTSESLARETPEAEPPQGGGSSLAEAGAEGLRALFPQLFSRRRKSSWSPVSRFGPSASPSGGAY